MWRRVIGNKNESIYDIPSNVVHHPPLSLTAAKELWIFWYGEEPDLTELVVPELLKANGEYFAEVRLTTVDYQLEARTTRSETMMESPNNGPPTITNRVRTEVHILCCTVAMPR